MQWRELTRTWQTPSEMSLIQVSVAIYKSFIEMKGIGMANQQKMSGTRNCLYSSAVVVNDHMVSPSLIVFDPKGHRKMIYRRDTYTTPVLGCFLLHLFLLI